MFCRLPTRFTIVGLRFNGLEMAMLVAGFSLESYLQFAGAQSRKF